MDMANRNFMLCRKSGNGMRLNESESVGGKYVLEGVFAELDTLNRNQRIYPKDEYLKHLQYLRDDIKSGDALFGELDHPDDRFEVKLKEASHRVTDLWYDPKKNVVMGKIELLDTPNGKIAKSIVDQGIPLHISSRAAGTVDPGDNKVTIQQIYTYDIVAKPGFSGAVLHRVNESAGDSYGSDVMGFLLKCEKSDNSNVLDGYGIVNEGLCGYDVNAPVRLRREAAAIVQNNGDVMRNDNYKPLFEGDDDNDEKKSKDSENGKDMLGFDKNDSDANDAKDSGNDESGDEGVKIIDVRGEFEDESDGVEILDVEEGGDDESGDKENDGKDEDDENEENESEDVDCDGKECDEDGDDVEERKKEVDSLNSEAESILDKSREKLKEIDSLISGSGKKKSGKDGKNECCESFAANAFGGNCGSEYAGYSEIMSAIRKTNEYGRMVENAKVENNGAKKVKDEPVWLANASEKYRKLYENADESVRKSIARTAEYVRFDNMADVNRFWDGTGLKDAEEMRLINEAFMAVIPKVSVEKENESLPYGSEFVSMVADMASRYDNR